MNGQESLTRLRMAGYRPGAVFLCIVPRGSYSVFTHPDMAMAHGGFPEIDVYPDEDARALDLRCIAGLDVHITGGKAKAVKALYDRVRQFRPNTITAVASDARSILRFSTGEESRLEGGV
ncbi:hypothetical protein ACOTC8_30140 [Achromobacter xylosoxidans]|uniref:hypothetical protein n=1 Tax=Alcaligenes xylosoxydans xylosoxydans TaxID=85698 RepID=UPI001F1378BE|nr:hypothetical protein [Achromobacter xylosoxidans]